MIRSGAGMRQNLELIGHMYEAIGALKRYIAPKNFTYYLILAEGPLEQIRRLKAEIDEYLGITKAVAQAEEDARDEATCDERFQEESRPLREFLAESGRQPSGEGNVVPA
jgi:hypothetical protein